MTDELDALAARLTDAQREALCGRYAWQSPSDEWRGEADLYALGLWNIRPKRGETILTPRGLAVRARLEAKEL